MSQLSVVLGNGKAASAEKAQEVLEEGKGLSVPEGAPEQFVYKLVQEKAATLPPPGAGAKGGTKGKPSGKKGGKRNRFT